MVFLARRIFAHGVLLLGATGCVTPEQHQEAVDELVRQVESLETQLNRTQASVVALRETDQRAEMAREQQLQLLRAEMSDLPRTMAELCAPATTSAPTQCEEPAPVRTIVMAADKMVVGELERVWIDPPGASLIARMDTGASSSSLHAAKLVEFERDGDDWVRFEIAFDGQTSTVERPVERYVRVYQQADVEGTRRPVVRLRVALGDIQDTFDFTLANRAHLDQEMLLGRNFLKDVALVDVGRQFVQPARRPAAD